MNKAYIRSRTFAIPIVLAMAMLTFVLLSAHGLTKQDPNGSSRLSLTSVADGFDGAFTFEGNQYGIENHISKGFFRTQIARPGGRPIITGSENDGIISVSFPTGTVKVNIVSPGRFSVREMTAIEGFVRSDDAGLVRRIVYEVRNARITEKRPFLKGFQVIAMFLGDGDVSISSREKNIDRSKLTFKMANANCEPAPMTAISTDPKSKKPSCDSGDCCGCCGAGCWGCSGCWTPECLAHDQCVDEYGYFATSCMALLPAAVASMQKCYGIE